MAENTIADPSLERLRSVSKALEHGNDAFLPAGFFLQTAHDIRHALAEIERLSAELERLQGKRV